MVRDARGPVLKMDDPASDEPFLLQQVLHREIVAVRIGTEVLYPAVTEFYAGVSDAFRSAVRSEAVYGGVGRVVQPSSVIYPTVGRIVTEDQAERPHNRIPGTYYETMPALYLAAHQFAPRIGAVPLVGIAV